MSKKVLVTGGCGYIGAHTIVDLIENGYDPICIDDNSKSTTELLKGVHQITGVNIENNCIDLTDLHSLEQFFSKENDLYGIIHFAAFKSVNESLQIPLDYMNNNLKSLLNILSLVQKYKVPNFIFSSSCSVYGNASEIPVSESTVLAKAESPYGLSKKIGEEIIESVSNIGDTKFVSLRYFNPAGAHMSGLIGEVPLDKPSNLVPAITFFASGKLTELNVFGTDYDTRDGSCIRDFVHVSDISHAHTKALENAHKVGDSYQVYNLGTGLGVTVLETIKAFEEVTGIKLNYKKAARRDGDVVAIYAESKRAEKFLNWVPKYSLKDIMKTAWTWEQKNI